MRLVVAVGLALVAVAAATAGSTRPARIVIVERTPLVVQGARFAPAQRVRISATSSYGRATRTGRTTVRGTFRVRFPGISLPGCAMVSIRVTATNEAPVVLRVVPECANGPVP